MSLNVALWAAQELAARAALGAAIKADRRRKRFPRRERRRLELSIFTHMIEKEEREYES